MQRSYSINPRTAKRFDLILDKLGFIWEKSDTRTRYAMRDFIVALTECKLAIDREQNIATITIDLPEK